MNFELSYIILLFMINCMIISSYHPCVRQLEINQQMRRHLMTYEMLSILLCKQNWNEYQINSVFYEINITCHFC